MPSSNGSVVIVKENFQAPWFLFKLLHDVDDLYGSFKIALDIIGLLEEQSKKDQ